eukprot:14927407-Ditylum_brightwellii.AAC.1
MTHQDNTHPIENSKCQHNSTLEMHGTEIRASGSAAQMTNTENVTTNDKHSARGLVEKVQDNIGTTLLKRTFQGQLSDIK